MRDAGRGTGGITAEDFDSLSPSEVAELARERPELFDARALREDRSLIGPALAAGVEVCVDGEATWAALEGNDLDGVWSETELRGYFEGCEDLAQQRESGTRFEDWIEENERYGLLTRTSDGLGNPPLSSVASTPSDREAPRAPSSAGRERHER